MINIVNEIYDLLNKYNLNLNDVILVVEGNIVKSNEFDWLHVDLSFNSPFNTTMSRFPISIKLLSSG